MSPEQTRTYDRARSVVFLKTNEPFGGLSNMAGGYPLHVQGVRILTSEALYQACRFPHLPEVQRLIVGQTSPMTAKMKSKPHRKDSRPDWDQVRVKVMRWCLRVKLVQNWSTFSELLLRTGECPIVEESRKDDFWGAKPVDEQSLVGMNVLGRLLMELREAVKSDGHDAFRLVEPLAIPNFMLFDRPIEVIAGRGVAKVVSTEAEERPCAGADSGSRGAEQTSLFDQPVVRERPPPVYLPISAEHPRLARLNPYPSMKNSGVEWLGEVPEHWEVKRLKMAVHLSDRKVEADEEHPVPYIGMENIESWTGRLLPIDANVIPSGMANEFKVGHTLFGKLRPYLAKACNPDFDGLCSTELLVLKGEVLDRRILLYSLLSDGFIKLVDSSTYGSKMPRSSWDFVGNCIVPIAPPEEQRPIADFLDRETAKIDALVAKKQTLIERLKEKRTALISRTVTRGLPPDAARAAGLDPHPKLKPSGIDWLGDVPEHWSVSPLKFLVSTPVTDGPHETPEILEEGVPFVSAEAISGGRINFEAIRGYISLEDHRRYSSKYKPRLGDIYMVKSGATTGRVAMVENETDFNIWSPLAAIRCNPRFAHRHFVLFYLQSREFQTAVELSWSYGTQQNIGMGVIQNLHVPVPSLSEQAAIAQYLSRATKRVDGMIAKVETAIERLKEYRIALITAAVTGKIDVRGAAVA